MSDTLWAIVRVFSARSRQCSGLSSMESPASGVSRRLAQSVGLLLKRDGIGSRNSAFANDFGCKKVPQLKEAISQVPHPSLRHTCNVALVPNATRSWGGVSTKSPESRRYFRRYDTASLTAFTGRALTIFRAGFALNIVGSFVNGLMPLRSFVAGFLITTNFANPGTRKAPDFLSSMYPIVASDSMTPLTSFRVILFECCSAIF